MLCVRISSRQYWSFHCLLWFILVAAKLAWAHELDVLLRAFIFISFLERLLPCNLFPLHTISDWATGHLSTLALQHRHTAKWVLVYGLGNEDMHPTSELWPSSEFLYANSVTCRIYFGGHSETAINGLTGHPVKSLIHGRNIRPSAFPVVYKM